MITRVDVEVKRLYILLVYGLELRIRIYFYREGR